MWRSAAAGRPHSCVRLEGDKSKGRTSNERSQRGVNGKSNRVIFDGKRSCLRDNLLNINSKVFPPRALNDCHFIGISRGGKISVEFLIFFYFNRVSPCGAQIICTLFGGKTKRRNDFSSPIRSLFDSSPSNHNNITLLYDIPVDCVHV